MPILTIRFIEVGPLVSAASFENSLSRMGEG
jgi:hypothetical protein